MSLVALYFHTLRHLRPVQIRHPLARRLLPSPSVPRRPVQVPARRAGLKVIAAVPGRRGAVSDSLKFTFLNMPRVLPPGRIDWAAQAMPKLWRYNLHYFDYLL